MDVLRALMWGSFGLIVWTHLAYPLAAAAGARLRAYRPRRKDGYAPTVALVIAAHNEAAVIEARLENVLARDYPAGRLEIVVSSDGSSDGMNELVARYADRGVRLLANPRAGKTAAQDAAVRATESEVIAFSDANSAWQPGALQLLVRNLADPEVGYVCGRLRLADPVSGENVEGVYWRYELWLRAQESGLGSITAGNGAIYAVRRSAYPELGSRYSHDIGLPYRFRRLGLRSVYEPEAVAAEPAAASTGAEWGRKVRMLSRSWFDTVRGGMLNPRRLGVVYYVELLSHRLLRYASGLLHVLLLASSIALASGSLAARVLLVGQLLWLVLAAVGWRWPGRVPFAGLAWYYLVVTAASLAALGRMLRTGPQVTWSPAEGTR
jgi:cellulose synthase/poly-beta-1,6-N-acetylglucosamine synthase-like glycosyltransferase